MPALQASSRWIRATRSTWPLAGAIAIRRHGRRPFGFPLKIFPLFAGLPVSVPLHIKSRPFSFDPVRNHLHLAITPNGGPSRSMSLTKPLGGPKLRKQEKGMGNQCQKRPLRNQRSRSLRKAAAAGAGALKAPALAAKGEISLASPAVPSKPLPPTDARLSTGREQVCGLCVCAPGSVAEALSRRAINIVR